MYERLDGVELRSGEVVEAGVVRGPDAEWAERVETLLGHKGPTWRWGNEVVLRREVGLEAYYYLLHRDGVPFANMMNVEFAGVGLFGHVFTKPEDRQKGAATALMARVMDHFRGRGGRALFLGTGYDSHPYHLYAKFGFVGLEPKSGQMAYYSESEEAFYAAYFPKEDPQARPLDWPHWPASIPLFAGDFEGAVRSVAMGIYGRQSTEGPMIPLQRRELERREKGEPPRSAVLVEPATGAVAGLSTFGPHPLWPASCTVDVYCHPDSWSFAPRLLEEAAPPEAERYLAYCEAGFEEKESVLEEAGFEPTATYAKRVAADAARSRFVDVREWERRRW